MPRKWPGPWRGCSWKWPHLSQIPPFYRLSFQSVQFSPKYFYMQDDGDKTRKTQKRQSLAVLLYGCTVLENRHKCLIGISNFDNTDTNLAAIDFKVDFWRENSNIFTLKMLQSETFWGIFAYCGRPPEVYLRSAGRRQISYMAAAEQNSEVP